MQDTDKCVDANWSTDGALRYANDIRSKAKSMRKFIPIGKTLKRIKPHTELFNFYGKHHWSHHK